MGKGKARRLGASGFGQRLKQARLQFGTNRLATMGQEELGGLLRVTGVTIGRWEDGIREPRRLAVLEHLAAILGVSPCWLAFGLGKPDHGDEGYDVSEPTEIIPDPRAQPRRQRA